MRRGMAMNGFGMGVGIGDWGLGIVGFGMEGERAAA